MADFSIANPSSWSLGNIAEAATESLTGSEFLGDMVGAGVSFFSGDMVSGFDNVMDGFENVASFLSDPRVGDAASDAFGFGSSPSPASVTDAKVCPDKAEMGEAAEEGTLAGSDSIPTNPGYGGGSVGSDTGPIGSSGSLEDRIFALLMKLIEKKEGDLEARLGDAEAAGEKGGNSEKIAMQKMQKANSELSAMNQMTTNLMQSFNQSRMAVIRNIRS